MLPAFKWSKLVLWPYCSFYNSINVQPLSFDQSPYPAKGLGMFNSSAHLMQVASQGFTLLLIGGEQGRERKRKQRNRKTQALQAAEIQPAVWAEQIPPSSFSLCPSGNEFLHLPFRYVTNEQIPVSIAYHCKEGNKTISPSSSSLVSSISSWHNLPKRCKKLKKKSRVFISRIVLLELCLFSVSPWTLDQLVSRA